MAKLLLNLNDLEDVVGGALVRDQVVVHVFTETNGAYVMHSNRQVAVLIPQDKYKTLFEYFGTDDDVVNYCLSKINNNNNNILTYLGPTQSVYELMRNGARISIYLNGNRIGGFSLWRENPEIPTYSDF